MEVVPQNTEAMVGFFFKLVNREQEEVQAPAALRPAASGNPAAAPGGHASASADVEQRQGGVAQISPRFHFHQTEPQVFK